MAVKSKKPATRKKAPTRTTKKKTATKQKSLGTCFVMMPFRAPFDLYYNIIFKPGISAANLEPVRADDLFRPSVIVSDLWQMIQEAEVLLAELTTKNANVFYELGLAHAIGKPIVLVSETMDDVPFDLQQLRVLLYDKNDPAWGEKLTKKITNALSETLNNPIESVPSIFRKTVKSQAPEQDSIHARLDNLESQIRLLRGHDQYLNSTVGRLVNDYESDLWRVKCAEDLDQWTDRWLTKGATLLDLLKALQNARFSVDEIDRIAEKFYDPKRQGNPPFRRTTLGAILGRK